MGNRAVITDTSRTLGIYLHWNGGRDSVEAFVTYCRLKHYRSPATDAPYALARLAQVIANFFGGTLSVGLLPYDVADEDMVSALDNGVYVIGADWQIVEHLTPFPSYTEDEVGNLVAHLRAIDAKQPAFEQLGPIIGAEDVPARELREGDEVWVYTDYRQVNGRYQGGYVPVFVQGTGDGLVNGTNVVGIPYVDLFEKDGEADPKNINNYLLEPTYRKAS